MSIQIIYFLFGEFLANTGNKHNNNFFFWSEQEISLLVIVPTSQALRDLDLGKYFSVQIKKQLLLYQIM